MFDEPTHRPTRPAESIEIRAYLEMIRSRIGVTGVHVDYEDVVNKIRVQPARQNCALMGPAVMLATFTSGREGCVFLTLKADVAEKLGRMLIRHARQARERGE